MLLIDRKDIRNMCAFFAPLAGELVLDAAEGLGAGNIVQGAETVASQFKNEIIKGIPWGIGEGAGFIAGSKVIENVKKDLGYEDKQNNNIPPPLQPPPLSRKRKRSRKIG